MAVQKISAGFLMYRLKNNQLEVFIAHPGGPFFKNKDNGSWSIPKGEAVDGEDLFKTAMREFKEETGIEPSGNFIHLDSVSQKNVKIVHAWAFEETSKPPPIPLSNTFEIEWPPRSGKKQKFPEIDRAEFFSADIAKQKIHPAQIKLIERLKKHLGL